MTEIKSVEQFNEKVKAFRGENKKTVSNCFLMPGEIMSLISENRIFIAEYPQWLLILCDREGYSNLYYYTTADSDEAYVKEFLGTVSDREIYMDIVTRRGRGDLDTPERLIKSGIAGKYKKYQRMQLPLSEVEIKEDSLKVAEGYTLTTDYCDYNELMNLWKNALDEKSTPLPTTDEIADLHKQGNIFSILTECGKLAAVIILSVSSKQGLLQHLSVSPEHRRKGLAASLMAASFAAAIKIGLNMVRLWVDCENTGAIALYDLLEFVTDGMICEQLSMFI